MNRILVPKEDDWDGDNKPVWHPVRRQDNSEHKPVVVCNCGSRLGLANHSISPNGDVNASFYHRDKFKKNDKKGCGWHVWITLENWSGSAFPIGDL